MGKETIDLGELSHAERHDRVHEAFETLDAGETLRIVNDHDPQPLVRELDGQYDAFDAADYVLERRGEAEFVAEFPKATAEMPDSEDRIRSALAEVDDPDLSGVDIVASGMVTDVSVSLDPESGEPEATIGLNTSGLSDDQLDALAEDVEVALQGAADIRRFQLVAGESDPGTGSGAGPGRGGGSPGDAGSAVQAVSEQGALERLGDVDHPDHGTDLDETGFVRGVTVDGAAVTVAVDLHQLSDASRARREELFDRMGSALYNTDGVRAVRVDTGEDVHEIDPPTEEDPAMTSTPGEGMGGPPETQGTTPLQQPEELGPRGPGSGEAPPTLQFDDVDRVVVVGSAKGGVGKTTVATQLALGLDDAADGDVGLLDADFSGADVPRLLDLEPRITEGAAIDPIPVEGLSVMSIGLMENHPTAWNGEMVHNALFNLLEDVDWDVETLVVDLPPGVSDTMMTFLQFVPIDGVVLVTTPYPTAVADTNEGASLFREGDVPVLGAVVNMAGFECPSCGDVHDLFEDGQPVSLEYPVLAELPFSEELRAVDGESPDGIRSLAETIDESVAAESDREVPDDAVDVREYPEHGRYEAVEDAFAAAAPEDEFTVLSDRHPAGLAVALLDRIDAEGGPAEVFETYAVTSLSADEWLLTIEKPAAADARAG
jgi:ATP-binding protein involved in chromosome partitioning